MGQRAEALRLYRAIYRAAGKMPTRDRANYVRHRLRHEYEEAREETNPERINLSWSQRTRPISVASRRIVSTWTRSRFDQRCASLLSQASLLPTCSEEQRKNPVNETLELMELSPIAGEMVGNLSVEQKNRATVSVDVASNLNISFLGALCGSVKMFENLELISVSQYNQATYLQGVIDAGIGRDVKDYAVESDEGIR